ncbi:hypothetical protein BJ875DRAFT_453988, partial [Amylocarpus encephaloides]
MVILLFLMFGSSNWFITYQEDSVNKAYFTTRTKALNNHLYFHAHIALAFLFAHGVIVWGGGYVFGSGYTRAHD